MSEEIEFTTEHRAKVGVSETYEYREYYKLLVLWRTKKREAMEKEIQFDDPPPNRPARTFYDDHATQYSFDIDCPECGVENNVQWDHYNDYEIFLDDESGAGEYAIHECDECGYEIPFKINVNLWVEYSLESVELDIKQIKRDMEDKLDKIRRLYK